MYMGTDRPSVLLRQRVVVFCVHTDDPIPIIPITPPFQHREDETLAKLSSFKTGVLSRRKDVAYDGGGKEAGVEEKEAYHGQVRDIERWGGGEG